MRIHKSRLLRQYGLNIPLYMWVLLGFFISYLFFFVRPIFFSGQEMKFFNYVPTINPIGIDLKQMLSYSETWIIDGQSPYIGNNLYPPLACVLFAPFLTLNFYWTFIIVSLATLFCYVLITFVFPLLTSKEKQVSPLLIVFLLTGLMSYGFQFELERGQFNVISAFICFLAIWIYHYHIKYRYLSYFLFTISVQLKIFPFIFIVMFITNWRDLKNNLKRLSALSAANIALLFVLGPQVFYDFVNAIKEQTVNPYIWIGNHSIHSFTVFASRIASEHGWSWVNQYTMFTQVILLIITCGCIFLIMYQAYKHNVKSLNPFLFIACSIGAMLIPSVSHDYKLSILASPIALLFLDRSSFFDKTIKLSQHIKCIILIIILSVAYSSTLFSFTNKPLLFGNNLPALFVMLLIITYLCLMSTGKIQRSKIY